jgi:hypothetical protein
MRIEGHWSPFTGGCRVAGPAEKVIESINHREVAGLPRGELFVGHDFLGRHFPEAAGDYPGQLKAAAGLLGLSAIGADLNSEESRSLLRNSGFSPLENYFVIGCVNGPFARLIDAEGFRGAMVSTRRAPERFAAIASKQIEEMKSLTALARENGFQAIALADDIAGKNGLLFSFEYFSRTIFPVYTALAGIIKESGLFAFLHSDGDMRGVISLLTEGGYDCLHPIDVQGGLDLYELKDQFGDSISFMGHMDIMAWDEKRIAEEIATAEKVFSKGGLILGSAGGISLDVDPSLLAALYPSFVTGEPRP